MDKDRLTREEKAILNELARHYHTISFKELKKQAEKIGLNPVKIEIILRKVLRSGEGIHGVLHFDGDTLIYL